LYFKRFCLENERRSLRLSKPKLPKPDPLQNEICFHVKEDCELGLSIKILKEKVLFLLKYNVHGKFVAEV
jgi:hypothetical protein